MTDKRRTKRKPPHLGMRIIKTGISVFVCLLMNYFFSAEVALVSSLAAIVSMQSTLQGTMKTAIARSSGTALGGFAGIAMLPLSRSIDSELLYIFLMPIGMILIVYLCILFKMPGSVGICAYVYITVLVAPMNGTIGDALKDGLLRIADTAFGVLVSILINRFIDPPRPLPQKDVDIPANPFAGVYARVSSFLASPAQLVLADTRLVEPDAARSRPPVEATGVSVDGDDSDSVSIPVPTVFSKSSHLDTVYIDRDYTVHVFSLPQKEGYVTIPCESYPVTVGWHVEDSGPVTYDLFRHDRKHTARLIRKTRKTDHASDPSSASTV